MSVEAIVVSRAQIGEMLAFARAAAPRECCGLMGGSGRRVATLYPLQNVAANPLVAYEAAAADLFAAQRRMRGRGEELLGIYHS
ncbi:MAG TPA: Mov34/MPN/PAD-1 family protein, partial [Pyrinomonadaceae bacterium]|nr:Mov34/MPN/PAD-1 family protein [Pyrinomonadaceae bacterium]